MKLRFFCFATAVAVFPLSACSDDPPGPAVTAGAPGVAGAGSGGQPAAGAGTAGQATFGGGGQGTAGRPTFGGGGSGGSPAPVAGGGSGGSATGGGSGGSATGGTGGSVVGGTSGGSAIGGGSAVPATFATLRAVLMETGTQYSCYGGICHDFPENHYFKLKIDGKELTDDQLYTMVTTYMTRDCGPAIDKANPAQSGLVRLLKGPCGETLRMPYGKCTDDGDEGCVPPATIAAIEQWIAAGAPR